MTLFSYRTIFQIIKYLNNDMYYKKIIADCLEKKLNIMILYINHNKKINIRDQIFEYDFIFLKKYGSFFDEIKLIYDLIKLVLVYLKNKDLNINEKKEILLDLISLETLNNIRIKHKFEKILKKTRYKNLICTFEGFNLEKIIFKTSKKFNNKAITIGYQHAPILNDQFSIYELQNTYYFPEVIMTTGGSLH